jgi:hypothetical protein
MKTYLLLNALVILLVLPFSGRGQLVILTGNITNQKTGNVLQSVNILETKSGIGTISNMEGAFSLMLKPGKAELIITRQGFNEFSKSLLLKNDTTINVALVPVTEIKTKDKDLATRETAEAVERKKQP